MSERVNHLGQPIGEPLDRWPGARPPVDDPMIGRFARVERLDVERHAADLHAAFRADVEGRIWTYLPYGPFDTEGELVDWMRATCTGEDPFFHAIVDASTGRALGVASYLRIAPAIGTIEVGHLNFSPALQRTPIATEAMYLMMRRAFDELGYRRYEWKCDALNAGSCRAAERLGFVPEGVWRQATMYKGRNRDTAWYAVIDADWPDVRRSYEAWLAPGNFDAEGRQRRRLATRGNGDVRGRGA